MRTRRVCLLLLIAALGLFACSKQEKKPGKLRGSGVQKTETRSIPAFDKLRVGSRIAIDVTIGKAGQLELTADDNLLPHVRAKVEAGLLTIDTDVKVKGKVPLTARVSTPSLSAVSGLVGARIKVHRLHAGDLEVSAAGASRIWLDGTAHALTLKATFYGRIDLSELAAQSAKIRLDGHASVRTGYLEELDATLLENSRLAYRGEPRITQNVKPPARLYRDER